MSNALTQEGRLVRTGDVVTLSLAGDAGAMVQIADTFTGTLAFLATADGQNYVVIAGTPVGGGTGATTTTAGGIWVFSVGGLLALRVSATALGSGAARVTMRATEASGGGGGGGGGTALLPTAPLAQILISQGVGVQPIFSGGTPFIDISGGIPIAQGFRTASGSGGEIWALDGKVVTSLVAIRGVRPAANAGEAVGDLANISDSTTVVWGATVVGGGSNTVLARWNGTVWKVVGIG